MWRKNKKRIVVAMSGGVDSSVAAALLVKQGFSAIGITLKTWAKEECGVSSAPKACCSLEAIARARAVALALGIPFYVLDASQVFKKEVIDYFVRGYAQGQTPNPCVVCNERVKFRYLVEKARAFGADFIATGHFAKVSHEKRSGRYVLKCGRDSRRDQSYFLFSLSQSQLSRAIFPLGELTKEEVRRRAKRMRLPTYNTASSQDICFVQEMGYAEYLRTKYSIEARQGDIVDTSGALLGRHKGVPFYTVGQRRGLGVAYREPLYVVGFDLEANRVIVGTKREVMKRSLVAHRLNWVALDDLKSPLRVKAKIRYNHERAEALVSPAGSGEVRVDFDDPQEAPTPGQAVVFYQRDTVVGGGWIKSAIG